MLNTTSKHLDALFPHKQQALSGFDHVSVEKNGSASSSNNGQDWDCHQHQYSRSNSNVSSPSSDNDDTSSASNTDEDTSSSNSGASTESESSIDSKKEDQESEGYDDGSDLDIDLRQSTSRKRPHKDNEQETSTSKAIIYMTTIAAECKSALTEVSAQEAAYNIFQLPMSVCSDAVTFIPTSPPKKRRHILRPERELHAVDQESTECFERNVLHHYTAQHPILNGICSATFSAGYTYSKRNPIHANRNEGNEDDNDEINSVTSEEFAEDGAVIDEENDVDNATAANIDDDGGSNADGSDDDLEDDLPGGVLELQDDDGYIHKRRSLRVIRYRSY
ncbi:hypothetical protein BDB00DRAFT_876682 [Zychaea mexicana]|uniref:uncharacterized protein n=1 Tax=Zychaea mexicana TaxID=64656 RepID=UPI0022FF3709|nr:uncharacterized protein BDB00DRAFT_876682 [Zychaea mexicana]KAI9489207.1 hypothetical protein BDB00DRAFT_876682 [Zychaea mexicana]